MGRSPCCSKVGLNRGAWTAREDEVLTQYIKTHGEGKWRDVPKEAGLRRCGKSCRLRWMNYLKPDIKRGNISQDEEDLIIRFHRLIGNRWSIIARTLGRTDNEIKNYWNTTLVKKVKGMQSNQPKGAKEPKIRPTVETAVVAAGSHAIRTKAHRCSKVFFTPQPSGSPPSAVDEFVVNQTEAIFRCARNFAIGEPRKDETSNTKEPTELSGNDDLELAINAGAENLSNFSVDDVLEGEHFSQLGDNLDNDFWKLCHLHNTIEEDGSNIDVGTTNDPCNWPSPDQNFSFLDEMLKEYLLSDDCFDSNS